MTRGNSIFFLNCFGTAYSLPIQGLTEKNYFFFFYFFFPPRYPEQRVIHLHHLKGGDRSQVEEVEEEEGVQTAAGLTPRGQRSWETAGQ